MHYGWIVVGAAFTVLSLAYGVQYSFDTTGSYVAAFGLGAVLNLLALVLAVLARPPASRPR